MYIVLRAQYQVYLWGCWYVTTPHLSLSYFLYVSLSSYLFIYLALSIMKVMYCESVFWSSISYYELNTGYIFVFLLLSLSLYLCICLFILFIHYIDTHFEM